MISEIELFIVEDIVGERRVSGNTLGSMAQWNVQADIIAYHALQFSGQCAERRYNSALVVLHFRQ